MMNAQLTVITPKRAASQFVLADKPVYLIGRSAENDVVIAEPSVSRQHAKLVNDDELWLISDLNSMNGLRSNGIQQQCCYLEDGAVVVIGNVPVLFKEIAEQQVLQQQQFDQWRVQQARQLSNRYLTHNPSDIQQVLAEALKLCQMERAALLLGTDLASLSLHSSLGVSKNAQRSATFFGSIGALQSVFSSGQIVVANDISQHQALAQRASTTIKKISAVACLPLVCQGEMLGLFYVDSQQPSRYLSVLDVELLQSLVNNLSVMLVSQQLDTELQNISVKNRHFS